MQPRLSAAGEFGNMSDPFRSLIDDFLGRPFVRFCPTDAWKPHVNVYETPDAFLVCVDLAGMKSEDIQVEAQGHHLVIRGRRTLPIPENAPPNETRVHLMEIDSGAFCREIELQEPINNDRITAAYHDGLLWITLPRQG
jgi:HSP20 family protein